MEEGTISIHFQIDFSIEYIEKVTLRKRSGARPHSYSSYMYMSAIIAAFKHILLGIIYDGFFRLIKFIITSVMVLSNY